MFERNPVAGKIFHMFPVHPIQYALLWYYIIEFPGSVNVEDQYPYNKIESCHYVEEL
jgi:hypothetical protein